MTWGAGRWAADEAARAHEKIKLEVILRAVFGVEATGWGR